MLKRSTTLIVEPNEFVRQGLRACLSETAYDVVAAVRTVAAEKVLELSPYPDLVILGPSASENLSAELESLLAFSQSDKSSRLVLLLDFAVESGLERFENLGFDALLSKDVSSEVLVRSLDLVMLGQQIFPMSRQPRLNSSSPSNAAADPRSRVASTAWQARPEFVLSEREIQALHGLTAGESNKVIAQRLLVSEATIKARIKSLLRKIGASNRTQAALWAVQNPDICKAPLSSQHVCAADQPSEIHDR